MTEEAAAVDPTPNLAPEGFSDADEGADAYPSGDPEPEPDAPKEAAPPEPEVQATPKPELEGEPQETPEPDKAETKPEETEEKKPEEEEPKPVDEETVRAELREVLEKIPPEKRGEFLGADNKAFAALRREKQSLKSQQLEYKQAYEAFDKERQGLEQANKGLSELLLKAQKDPEEALKLLNWDFESLMQYKIDGKIPPERAAAFLEHEKSSQQTELEKQRAALEEQRRQLVVQQADVRINAYKNQAINEVNQLVKPEAYPFLAKMVSTPEANVSYSDIVDQVFAAQTAEYQRTNKQSTLTIPEILGNIETELATHAKILGLAPPVAPRTSGANEAPEAEKTGSQTLTSQHAAERTVTPSAKAKPPKSPDDWSTNFDEEGEDYDPEATAHQKHLDKLQRVLSGEQ